jgi:hypothetical protein
MAKMNSTKETRMMTVGPAIQECCRPMSEQQSSDGRFVGGGLGCNCLEKAGWHKWQDIPCVQAADLDMAEFEPAMGVAHPDLLFAFCPTIIILRQLDRKYQLWRLIATLCRILQDMYTGYVSRFWRCIALLSINLARALVPVTVCSRETWLGNT